MNNTSPLINVSNYTEPTTYVFNVSYAGGENFTSCYEAWTLTLTELLPTDISIDDVITLANNIVGGTVITVSVQANSSQWIVTGKQSSLLRRS